MGRTHTPRRSVERLGSARRDGGVRGFSLLELMLVVAVFSIVGAMAVPAVTNTLGGIKVGIAAREVERELQTARLRAVSTNRTLRLRFNCPSTGQYRLVELLGTPSSPAPNDADSQAATRCSSASYPYPDTDRGIFDIPNHDGPVKQLANGVAFGTVRTLEFRPDGTAHIDAGSGNPWPVIPAATPVEITLYKLNASGAEYAATLKRIQVNGLGKIQLQ